MKQNCITEYIDSNKSKKKFSYNSNINTLKEIIDLHLNDFYNRRIGCIKNLSLGNLLRRKNPYLYKSIGIETPEEFIKQIIMAYISSSDETIFGDAFLEPIARIVSNGNTSDAAGIDFSITNNNKYTCVSMKSGPNIFNSSQKKRMEDEFRSVRSRVYKEYKVFDAILGHAYGKYNDTPTKTKIYRNLSGQLFWEEMTGDKDFYLKLINLIDGESLKYKKEYEEKLKEVINKFIIDFKNDFYDVYSNKIMWEKLTIFVSENTKIYKNNKIYV